MQRGLLAQFNLKFGELLVQITPRSSTFKFEVNLNLKFVTRDGISASSESARPGRGHLLKTSATRELDGPPSLPAPLSSGSWRSAAPGGLQGGLLPVADSDLPELVAPGPGHRDWQARPASGRAGGCLAR